MALYPNALPAAGSAVSTDTLAAAGHTALHNTSYDEARAIATKIGIGASTPTNAMVLRGNGAGTSAWAQVGLTTDVTGTLPQANGGTGTTSATGTGAAVYQTSPTITTPTIADFTNAQHNHTNAAGGGQVGTNALSDNSVTNILLSVEETTDLFSGTALVADTWTDCVANKNFTVTSSTSVILINIRAKAQIGSTSAVSGLTSRVVIDSGGTPINKILGGSNTAGANGYNNPFAGSCQVWITGLSAGVHTVKSQVLSRAANSALYLRIATAPLEGESYSTEVIEFKK